MPRAVVTCRTWSAIAFTGLVASVVSSDAATLSGDTIQTARQLEQRKGLGNVASLVSSFSVQQVNLPMSFKACLRYGMVNVMSMVCKTVVPEFTVAVNE